MAESSGRITSTLNRLKFPVTVEPIIFFYTVSVGLNEVVRSNLIINKICISKLNYTAEVCDHLSDEVNKHAQETVQDNVSEYESLYSTAAFAPRIVFGLVAGTWSDRNGRKALLGLPILGQLLASLSYIVNYLLLHQLPWQMLFLEFLNELTGTYVTYYLAIYSYITDVSDENSRTFRLSVVDGMDYVSTSIGTLISGPIFISGGYYAVFGGSAGSCVLCLIILVFWVKESLKKSDGSVTTITPLKTDEKPPGYGSNENQEVQDDPVEPHQDEGKPPDQNGKEIHEAKNFLVLGFSFMVDSLRTVLKSRKWPRRPILWLGIFNFACFIFAYNGTEGTHRYLYARNKYGWSEQEFTKYLFNYRIAYMVALWIVCPVLSRILRIPDPIINILACCASSIGFILPAVTSSSVWFTIGSFICMFSPLTTITTRSVLSRAVASDEMGRVYSVLALFSAASGSLVEAAFQKIYNVSLGGFLGSYLLVNAGLLLVTIPVSCVIMVLLRRLEV